MLNFGDKKKIYSNSRVVQKTITPPLQVKWSVPKMLASFLINVIFHYTVHAVCIYPLKIINI